MNKSKFNDRYVPQNVKTAIISGAVAAYILAGLSFLAAMDGSIWFIPFGAAFALLGAGVHIFKSRICAVGLLVVLIPWAVMFIPRDMVNNSYYTRRYHNNNRYIVPSIAAVLFAVAFIKMISAVFRYQKIKKDFSVGTDGTDDGRKNIFTKDIGSFGAPKNTPTYTMEKAPLYSQADTDYNYGSQPVQDEYKKAWEMEDINTDRR